MEHPIATHGFRKKLKECLPLWQERGFISPQQTEAITAYYRLDGLKSELSRTVVSGIYLIGVLLIGVGIISFIAAHWTAIGREAKVAMLFAALLAAHGGGWYLWLGSGRMPRLGHALVVLGTLIFGANIGLIAQIFHIHENPANGYLAWAIGAAAVAYALQSTPNALVSIVVSMIYCFVKMDGWPPSPQWFPIQFAVIFIPLAYLCRSRWVLWAILIGIVVPVIYGLGMNGHNVIGNFIMPVFLGVAFYAWGTLNQRSEHTSTFALPCKIAGGVLCFLFLYLLSFWEIAVDINSDFMQIWKTDWTGITPAGSIYVIAIILVVAAIIDTKVPWCRKSNLILLLLAAIMVTILSFSPQTYVPPAGAKVHLQPSKEVAFGLVVAVHLLMLLLAGNLIRLSIQTQSRGLFWAGIWLPGLIILSRTLEYETELLLKAIVFAACGVALIVAGVMFERQLKKKGAANV